MADHVVHNDIHFRCSSKGLSDDLDDESQQSSSPQVSLVAFFNLSQKRDERNIPRRVDKKTPISREKKRGVNRMTVPGTKM